MVVLKGRKAFWFLPPGAASEAVAEKPRFTSVDAVARHIPLGLRRVELLPGDLLCFPGNWLHEVHNMEPDSMAVTNAVSFPKEAKKEELQQNVGRKRKPMDPRYLELVVARASKK